jgi:hypothetical protein
MKANTAGQLDRRSHIGAAEKKEFVMVLYVASLAVPSTVAGTNARTSG